MTDPIKIKVRRAGWVIDVAEWAGGDAQTVTCDDVAWTKEQAKSKAKEMARKMGGAIIEIETIRGAFVETVSLEPVVGNGPELPFKTEDGPDDPHTPLGDKPEPKEEPQSVREKFGFGGSK